MNMKIQARLVEIRIDPHTPYKDMMRFITDYGDHDVTVPYDSSFRIGEYVTIEITKESK